MQIPWQEVRQDIKIVWITQAIIEMKKLLAITILGMLFCNTSFALSSDRANYEYEVCREGMVANGNTQARAAEYCKCAVTMISNKYTDKKFDKIIMKGNAHMMKKINFASVHCNKYKNAK